MAGKKTTFCCPSVGQDFGSDDDSVGAPFVLFWSRLSAGHGDEIKCTTLGGAKRIAVILFFRGSSPSE